MIEENHECNVFNEEGDKVYWQSCKVEGKNQRKDKEKIKIIREKKLSLYSTWVQYIKDEIEHLKTW